MEYRTKTGRVLTDADIEALADEAERGYDIERLRAQNPRVGFLVGRFVLQQETVPEGWYYVTSWDTWEDSKVAWGDNGLMPPKFRLTDGETGRVWWPGAPYEWEAAQT